MDEEFRMLIDFLIRVPSVETNETPSRGFGCGQRSDLWWVKFTIDITHPLAWRAVQELGHVLNSLSITEPLPTVFKPVSPPPYLNGGSEFLSWLIECPTDLKPGTVAKWLESRLPQPVDDLDQWAIDPA